LALALDESKANDSQLETGGITYLIDKDLESQTGLVTVDFVEQGWRSGFMVSSEKPIASGASSCGGSCSC